MELNKILKMKESNIEFKKAKNQVPKSFWETYSAINRIYLPRLEKL